MNNYIPFSADLLQHVKGCCKRVITRNDRRQRVRFL